MLVGKLDLGFTFPHIAAAEKNHKKTAENYKKKFDSADFEKLDDRTKKKIHDISQIAETEANRDRTGEAILQKAEAGKELSEDEMKYLAEKYPDAYRKIKAAQLERKMLKSQIENARTKTEVAIAFSDSVMRARESAQDDWELKMRVNQLADEYGKYVKSDEYKEKADSPDEDEKNRYKPAKLPKVKIMDSVI